MRNSLVLIFAFLLTPTQLEKLLSSTFKSKYTIIFLHTKRYRIVDRSSSVFYWPDIISVLSQPREWTAWYNQ